MKILIAVVIVETILLLLAVLMAVKNRKAQKKLTANAGQLVKGRLFVDDVYISGLDSNYAMLAKSFNTIKNNLLAFIESTKGNVVTLSDAINVLSDSVDALKEGNTKINDSLSHVAYKVSDQLQVVRNNLDTVKKNTEEMNRIEESMNQIQEILDATTQISKEGMDSLLLYESNMSAVTQDLQRIDSTLTDFNDGFKRIGEVSSLISNINNQLRMLALNASIEAERAGAAGKGFVVVADEMNEMSLKTRAGMDSINQIVQEIVNHSRIVNDSIRHCENTFLESKTAFAQVNKSFRDINEKAFSIQNNMKNISTKVGQISDNSEEIKNMAMEINDASSAISESTDKIVSSAEESAAETLQIGENVTSLKDMLHGIEMLLRRFNTAVVPVDKPAVKQLRIGFFSMYDNEFWYGVQRGVSYAIKELSDRNVIVKNVPLTPDETMGFDDYVRMKFQECIDSGVDALIFPGFFGCLDDILLDALHAGIQLMTYNCDCSPKIKRKACLMSDNTECGALAAKEMIKCLNQTGSVAIITGPDTMQNYVERKNGFMTGLEKCRGIHVTASVVATENNNEAGETLNYHDMVHRKTLELLKSGQRIDGIYVTLGEPVAVAEAIQATGNLGKVKVVCFDHSPEIFAMIKKGIIASAIGNDAFGQGHDPIILMYNHLVTGNPLPGDIIPCRMSVVDSSNIDTVV